MTDKASMAERLRSEARRQLGDTIGEDAAAGVAAPPSDVVDMTTAIVRAPQVAPLTLFGTSDPVGVLHEAARVAVALKGVLVSQHLYATINRKNYVTVEGWTLLGSMLGVFPRIEWTRRVRGGEVADFQRDGWEARAVAVVASTQDIIGAAEAMCTREELKWKGADDYALRGMAQTRAISRALRGPLDFVIKLAGFASTPAEEVPHDSK